MIKTKVLFCILMSLFCLFVPMANSEMSSTSYRISTTAISGGGNTMSSPSYGLRSTLGQSSPLGSLMSASYQIDQGFWFTLLLTIAVGDVNGDGIVNLGDVITALQVVAGQAPETIIQKADTTVTGV